MRNVVFRSIQGKWRGPLPCARAELTLGILLLLAMTPATNLLAGGAAGIALIAALASWRRLDHDRSDYLTSYARRRFAPIRTFNGNEPDEAFVPFEPR